MKYRTIVADPPWPQPLTGGWRQRPKRAKALPYASMAISEITALPIEPLAADDCHLWLWTTNAHLESAFQVLRAWGFRYLTTITWVKPSGVGAYFIGTTQHCLFGYRRQCRFPGRRYAPTHFQAGVRGGHSTKPESFVDLVEAISPAPRLELFARQNRLGWDTWGNEALNHVAL